MSGPVKVRIHSPYFLLIVEFGPSIHFVDPVREADYHQEKRVEFEPKVNALANKLELEVARLLKDHPPFPFLPLERKAEEPDSLDLMTFDPIEYSPYAAMVLREVKKESGHPRSYGEYIDGIIESRKIPFRRLRKISEVGNIFGHGLTRGRIA